MAKTILIIEDDPELQDLYAAMLIDTDYQIIEAFDGGDGLQRVAEAGPDLIILDIVLDEMMGDEFFRRIKQEQAHADIPLVVVSVLTYEQCEKMLAIDPRTIFLRKPFRRQEFLAAVEQGLAQTMQE
jgi:DNA-binding response OmpR family regulator